MSADALSGVIAMPKLFRNKRIEVIIREAPKDVPAPRIDTTNIGCMMDGSITQSLIGIVPNSEKTLEDYREERLANASGLDAKYGS
jgi:hypothetical protein